MVGEMRVERPQAGLTVRVEAIRGMPDPTVDS